MNRGVFVAWLVVFVAARAITDAFAQPQADMDLYEAIRTDRLEQVERYLAGGGDPNGVIVDSPMGDARPLRVAVAGKRERIVLALLRAGGRIELASMNLGDVSAAGMAEALSFLLTNGSAPELSAVKAAIDSAVGLGHYDSVVTLLDYLRTTDAEPSEPLWDAMNRAIGRRFDDIARLLLENGAPASGAALRAAALHSSPGMVRYLLSLGADPFERYRDPIAHIRPRGRDGFVTIDYVWEAYQQGTAAQRRAATFKMFDLLAAGVTSDRVEPTIAADGDALLERIADPAARLRTAAEWGFYDTVHELLSARTIDDPELLREATIAALRVGWDDIARLLLQEGAPPGSGPLHVAVRSSSPGMVRYLLALGADPNELVGGYTPVQYWLRNDPAVPPATPARGGTSPEVLHELIIGGADVCLLVEHRDELAEQPFSFGVLWHSASECWPEQQLD